MNAKLFPVGYKGAIHPKECVLPNFFSATARSERQFATMLLPHLLMADGFAGAIALFKRLGLPWDTTLTEAVAELNPIRDIVKPNHAGWSGEMKAAVPDLFFRNGDTALVIEAKFFTHPSSAAIVEQLRAQEAAIQLSLPGTDYGSCRFHYLALTILSQDDICDWPTEFSRMTWSEIIETIEPVVTARPSADKDFALSAIRDAVKRSLKETKTSSTEIGRVQTIQKLLEKALDLLESGYQYVGFVGGMDALTASDLKTLETRGHYKYSDCQPNKNWISLAAVVAKYLELKADAHAKPLE